MTSNEYTIHYKTSLLEYAYKFNVSLACRVFHISRTRYYEIAADFLKYGKAGLLPKPKCPKMPSKIRGYAEKAILDLSLEFPTFGPLRLANELREKTKLSYSSVGIYFVLKRNNLNRKRDRLHRSYLTGSVISLEALRSINPKPEMHIKTDYTGELLGQDSFYLGTIKGIGRIYSQAVIDCNSSFAFAKLYSSKGADAAIDILRTRVIPFYKAMNIVLKRIITDNGKEYTHHSPDGALKHKYGAFLKSSCIVHSLTKVRCPETNGYVERFHRTILDEFFLIKMRVNEYKSLNEIQRDLDKFMVEYNYRRTHQGRKLGGTAPIVKFVSGIKFPLMIESKN
jgi:transposase InsO family protein